MWSYESVVLVDIGVALAGLLIMLIVVLYLFRGTILTGLLAGLFWATIWLSINIPVDTWQTHHNEYYFPELTQSELCTLLELDETTNIHQVELIDYDEYEGLYTNVTLDFIVTRPNKDSLNKIDELGIEHYKDDAEYKLSKICGN